MPIVVRGAMAAARFGAQVTGETCAQLAQQQRFVSRTTQTASRFRTTAHCMLLEQDVTIDPLFAATFDPAAEWLRLAWFCPHLRPAMEQAMAAAMYWMPRRLARSSSAPAPTP